MEVCIREGERVRAKIRSPLEGGPLLGGRRVEGRARKSPPPVEGPALHPLVDSCACKGGVGRRLSDYLHEIGKQAESSTDTASQRNGASPNG